MSHHRRWIAAGAIALGLAVGTPAAAHAYYYAPVTAAESGKGCEHPDKPGDWYLSGMWTLRNDGTKITCRDGKWY